MMNIMPWILANQKRRNIWMNKKQYYPKLDLCGEAESELHDMYSL